MKYGFGVDIGGTTIKIGLFSKDGELIEKWEIPTNKTDNGKHILTEIADFIDRTIESKGIDKNDVFGVGLGVPGPVNKNGEVNGCVNLGWNTFNVEKEFNEISGFNVKVGNDANVAALGEMWQGAGKGYQDVLMVTLGTGVGGGCVLDGKIISGMHGAGGEIGHMPVRDDEPTACNCGNHGCLEQYVSATGIVTQAKKVLDHDNRPSSLRDYDCLEAKHIYDEAKNGDEVANEIVDLTCKILAKSLAQVCCVMDPEIIVIGGGVSKAGDILTSRISTFFKEYAFHACENIPVVLAKLENDAGMYGCVKSLF
ncbi:ROK family glucokinase [uncultured Holdemanella sp.]|uniref:ROK family glucokinase n=1 Tax=uncultured Holdemanella sp. TaxID=1763549 RepID=UPI0025ED11F5|nr:ROK family glucokinase [uncultured Holdemanella sp.]